MKLPPLALWPIALSVAVVVGGCAQLSTTRLTLPASHTVVRDQLVIHSDFPLAASHRLLEELAARRIDVAELLGTPVSDEPIHVYMFEDADRFEAFVRLYHPDFPPRRAYFLETDTRLEVYAQWGDRVAEDLRHEITHGYLHSVVPNLPLWLDEGLAEYFEVPRGSRGVNHSHVAGLAGRLRLGQWQPDLRRMERFERPFEMTQDDYAEAWAWVHFLVETAPGPRGLLREYLLDLRRDGSAGISTSPSGRSSSTSSRWQPPPAFGRHPAARQRAAAVAIARRVADVFRSWFPLWPPSAQHSRFL